MALVLMSNGPTCSGPTRFSTLKRAFLLGVHYIAPWRRRTGIEGRFGPRTTATGMRGSLPHRGDDSAAGSNCPEGTTTAGNAFGPDRTGPLPAVATSDLLPPPNDPAPRTSCALKVANE
jgi:hypothetical protein